MAAGKSIIVEEKTFTRRPADEFLKLFKIFK
jgi:hypothetical protein